MKFGLMTQLQLPRPWTEASERDAFHNCIDQAVAGEKAGFSNFWITEQHFFEEIGHCPTPEMVLAAISQRTTTMRLGFSVILVPLHNPFFVAERVATLDILSNGRCEFGAGRGTTNYVVEGLNFDAAKGRDMGREALDAILLMFENHLFPGFKGEHYDLKPRHMIPKPVQRPHPPLWVAASALDSWHYAGLQGFGCIGVTRNTPAETAPFVRAYREAIAAADPSTLVARVPNNRAGVFAIGVVDDDDARGQAAGCAAARWYYGDNDAPLNKVRFTTDGGLNRVTDKIASRSNDQLIEDAMAIGGNPDRVCRQVEKWAKIGIDQFNFFLQAGRTTHDQVMRSIDLIGKHIIPRFGT